MQKPSNGPNFFWIAATAGALLVIVVAGVAANHWGLFETRVNYLVRVLRTSPDAERRGKAAQQLGEMGAAARPAAEALADALRDKQQYLTPGFLIPFEHWVSEDAFSALKKIGGRETAFAAARVMQEARDQDYMLGGRAGEVLQSVGRDARPAASLVLKAIDGSHEGEPIKQALLALEAMQLDPAGPEAELVRKVVPQFVGWGDGIAERLLAELSAEKDGGRDPKNLEGDVDSGGDDSTTR